MAGVSFTEEGAKRIAGATVQVERWAQNKVQPKKTTRATGAGRWIQIGEGSGGKYSWTGVKLNDDGEMEADEDWGTGDHTKEGGWAVEVKYKSEHVIQDSIVWAMPAPGRDCYVFEYDPGILICRLAANNFLYKRYQISSGLSRPTAGYVELLRVNPGANPDNPGDDQWELTGKIIEVYNWTYTDVGGATARPVTVQFGSDGLFWVTGSDCI